MSTPAKTILDLGCGSGHQLLHAYQKGTNIIGVDIDKENLKIATTLMPNGTFVQADLRDVDLSSYSNVTEVRCTEVLEHIHTWELVVNQLKRLSSGTQLLITVPHEESEKKLLAHRPDYWKEIGHLHFFDGRRIVTALQDAGFRDITIT